MATIKSVNSYCVRSSDEFFFDNNIWMYLFAQIAGTNIRLQTAYAKLLGEIQSARATIYINSIILSEYVNRSLRLSFNLWRENGFNSSRYSLKPDFKRDFRHTEQYQYALADVQSEVNEILKIAQKRPDDFNAIDISELFDSTVADFNDSYIIEFCKLNKLKLVTNDFDIIGTAKDIEIITANIKL